MRSLAIINQKGGVGKTTTAVNLSAALAEQRRRIGLIDLDPQAHATMHFGLDQEPDRLTMYDVMTGRAELPDVWGQAADNLWVAGGHIDLAAVEVELADMAGRELVLRNKIRAAAGRFERILIDCPPSLGILTLNALSAVDDVLLPMQPHFLALHGLSKLLETIALVARRLNGRLRLAGVVFCISDSSTRLAAEVIRDVEEFFAAARGGNQPWSDVHIFSTRIRRNVRLAEAPSFGQSIFAYAPNSNGAADYRALADEVVRLVPTSSARREPMVQGQEPEESPV